MAELKETKDVVKAAVALSVLFIEAFKDGAQIEDASLILNGLVSKPEFKEALNNMMGIPAEWKELDAAAIVDLVMSLVAEVPKLINAFKKEA